MATKVFYIKGTDTKVRTSKTNDYTHAIMAGENLVCCCGSLPRAEKEIERLAFFHYPCFNADDAIRYGIYLYPARKLDEAVRFFKEHDAELGQVATGSVRSFGCTRGVSYYGREATEKELEAARERIEKRNKYREGLRIVELEAREK